MIMSKAERKAYDRHIDNIMVQNDVLDTAKMEGRKEGRKEAIRVTAKNLKAMGLGAEAISQVPLRSTLGCALLGSVEISLGLSAP